METNTNESTIDVYALVTNQIIEKLNQGKIPWRQEWTAKGIPKNCVSNRPYSGINAMLLNSLPYDHNLFLTWKQLKTLGGSVIKGQRGNLVVYTNIVEQKDEVTNEVKKISFLKFYKVFNVAQCTDIPKAFLPKDNYEHEKLAHYETIGEDMPKRPEIIPGSDKAYYSPKEDTIHMPRIKKFKKAEKYYAVLFHELIHSTGHESRLNRHTVTDKDIVFGDTDYSYEELIAEIGACFLQSYSGLVIEDLENHVAYIHHWLEVLRDDKRFIIKAASAAQKAVEYILNKRVMVENPTETRQDLENELQATIEAEEFEYKQVLDEVYAD